MHKIVSSAIAASVLLGCGAASAAAIRIDESTTLEIEGTIEAAVLSQKQEVTEAGVTRVERRTEVIDVDSTVQFDGAHILRNGWKTFFRAEFNFETDEDVNRGFNDVESAYAGIEHKRYGRIWAGFDDGFYDNWINDEVADEFQVQDPSSPSDSDVEDALLYQTPSFGGLTLGGAVSFKGGRDNPNFQTGVNEDPGSETAIQLGAQYKRGIYTFAAVFDDRGTQFNDADPLIGGIVTAKLSPFFVGVRAEFQGDSNSVDDDQSFIGVGVGYDYGVGRVYGVVNQVDVGNAVPGGDRTELVWTATYNLGTVEFYIENGFFDRDGDRDDLVAVGFEYSF